MSPRRRLADCVICVCLWAFGCCQLFVSDTLADSPNLYGAKRTVTTSFGVIRGETVMPPGSAEADLPAVTQFLGVPYGVAPLGQNRFNMPQSAAKWTHQPKDAFKLPPVCVQSGLPHLSETEALKFTSGQRFDQVHKLFPHLKPQSEDCLYMNLFVPERVERSTRNDSDQQLSALVIVHGSDYGWGSGNVYNGSILAAFGQMIVVTLNYRLGIYGFLGRCEPNSCLGNAGMNDLVAALKMLSNILPSFGGDPDSVTMLGWGSGGALISLLMASPMTQPKNRRLFKRAILLDGTSLSPWALVGHPQQYFMRLATELSCTEDGNGGKGGGEDELRQSSNQQKHISQILRCLQEHGQQNLTAAAKKIHAPTFLQPFGPIVDGQVVPNLPRIVFSSQFGALFRDIDLMIGSCFGSVHYPAHHLIPNNDIEHGMEPERRDQIVRTLVRNLYDYHRREIYSAIVNEYTDWENPRNHPKTIRNSLLAALGDVLYTSPLIETARMHSTSSASEVPSSTSNTFFFLFAHETKSWAREQPNTGIRGTLTDEHVPYILGYPLTDTDSREREGQIYTGFNNDDKGISRVMMRYVSNFVRSGTIVEERYHGTVWPQFSSATREALLEISDRPRVRNFYRNSFVGFWNTFVPQLNRAPPSGAKVPEEHNFLPNHFDRHSFFGAVRPYSALHNDPFPPPPLPPTPFPMDSLKKLASSTGASLSDGAQSVVVSTQNPLDDKGANDKSMVVRKSENYGLAITVAVGVGFLVLNLCLYIGMLRLCSEKRRNSTKHLKYQSYATTIPNADMTSSYLHNSTYGHQRLPPPPAPVGRGAHEGGSSSNYIRRESHLAKGGANRLSLESSSTTQRNISITTQQAFAQHSHSGLRQSANFPPSSTISPNGDILISSAVAGSARRASLHEQEPLLTKTALHPGAGGLLRTGISPTCPRHGRAAQLAASRANSIGAGSSAFVMQSSGGGGAMGSNTGTANMEEVQV